MAPVTIYAPAKINLHLHITGRRDDGYHMLDSLVAFTDLYDKIQISDYPNYQLNILNSAECPTDDNLVTRATNLIASHFNIEPHIRIDLTKSIPMGAGLGGGSSDAAATLLALRNYWNLDAPDILLQSFASKLGSDIVACLKQHPVIMRNTGNVLQTAPRLPVLYGALVTPPTPCPTPLAYKAFSESSANFSKIVDFPNSFETPHSLCHFLNEKTQNDLTDATISINRDVGDILNYLKSLKDGLLTRVSGSGSSCYTIFEDGATSIEQQKIIQTHNPDWRVTTIQINS